MPIRLFERSHHIGGLIAIVGLVGALVIPTAAFAAEIAPPPEWLPADFDFSSPLPTESYPADRPNGSPVCTESVYHGGVDAYRTWYGSGFAPQWCAMEKRQGMTVAINPDSLPSTYTWVCTELITGVDGLSLGVVRANALGREAANTECFSSAQRNGTESVIWPS